MNKCIRMGITASNLSFGEVNWRFYGRKLRFTAPLTRRRKTKFPTVKPPIYLPKCQIWKQLSPKWLPDNESWNVNTDTELIVIK